MKKYSYLGTECWIYSLYIRERSTLPFNLNEYENKRLKKECES